MKTKQLIEKQIAFFERMVKQHPQIKDHQERLKYYQEWRRQLYQALSELT